ncbi:MAG TPA: DUF2213 domain-containing protein [Methylophilaceae bacterium]
MKKIFHDRANTHDRMGFLIDEKLSPKQSLTPEGFLLCEEVPIARIGEQLYAAEELPNIEPAGDGIIKILRDPEEVFREETMASFEGKPVTLDHPNETVDPSNWKSLAVGIVQNVRRGEGIQDDLLIADLLITDQVGIEAVRGGLREVSCGYEADYEQIEPGRGRQTNIIGNHVALVERGRAGPRCSIQDKETTMSKQKQGKPSFLDKLRKFIDSEAEELEKIEDSDAEEKTEDEDPIETRLAALEAGHAEILAAIAALKNSETADSDEEEERKETDDEESEEEGEKTDDDILEAETAEHNGEAEGRTWDSIRARAEILAPGISLPTNDSLASKPKVAEALMRKALTVAYATEKGAKAINPFLAGRKISKLTGDALHSVFTGAAELIRAQNNAVGVRSAVSTRDFGKAFSPAEINARNREFWANRSAH